MFYKGIIFDLDNTIYNYSDCHETAILNCFSEINRIRPEYDIASITTIYDTISNELKYELHLTASTHNKSIYIKKIVEKLNLGYNYFSKINKLYWETFYENMKCYDGVRDFIIWNKEQGIKIGILTDYETEYQVMKLEKLDLLKYIDNIITSEEVGIEKPSNKMFLTLLTEMKMKNTDVIMIGDNFNKDILGAIRMGIFGYLFSNKNVFHENYIEFDSFFRLHSDFIKIHFDINQYVELSRFCGERYDLVQAGGGNISVKSNDIMIIKSSGIHMANVSPNTGYTIIDNSKLVDDITNNIANLKSVKEYNYILDLQPSIETYMHSILKKYTIHLHPIQCNRILVSEKALSIIGELFQNEKVLVIDYFTPGIKLSTEIKKKYNNENIIFLINHGIIITCDNDHEIYSLLENVLEKFEKYQGINYSKYKFTNTIRKYIKDTYLIDSIACLCNNETIYHYLKNKQKLYKEKITFPDCLIFCGMEVLFITDISDIRLYYEKYNEIPKIMVYNGFVYIIGNTLQKCKDTEDVFMSNLLILDTEYHKNYLSFDELCYLNNWDAEKYRKML